MRTPPVGPTPLATRRVRVGWQRDDARRYTAGAMTANVQKCDGRGFAKDCLYPVGTHSDGSPVTDQPRCVFHSEDIDKDPGPFVKALEEMRKTERFDCNAWVFPIEIKIENFHIGNSVTFYQDGIYEACQLFWEYLWKPMRLRWRCF